MTGKQNAPEIRFEGFADPWEQRKFSDVFDFLRNNTLSRAELSESEGHTLNIHYGDILVKFGEVIDANRDALPRIANDGLSERLSCHSLADGDVIIADTAEDEAVGKCSELRGCGSERIVSGLHTMACRPMDEFAQGYLGYYLNSSAFHNQLLPLMQGIKVISISKGAISDTDVRFPSLPEQHAIGQSLSSLDNLITLHQRKYDKLCTVKKSMLDKMFPKPGETEPEIRFEGFTDPWEQRKLGDVATIVGGGTPSTNNDAYWDGDIDWYSPAELGEQVYADRSVRRITQAGYDSCSATLLPAGKTILFTSRAGIGNTAILRRSACTNQGFQSLVVNDDADVYFVYSMTDRIKKFAEQKASGSTFLEISGKGLAAGEFAFPSKDEQTAIGSMFKQLDHLITLHQRKLELLRNIKKSLLDRMFV